MNPSLNCMLQIAGKQEAFVGEYMEIDGTPTLQVQVAKDFNGHSVSVTLDFQSRSFAKDAPGSLFMIIQSPGLGRFTLDGASFIVGGQDVDIHGLLTGEENNFIHCWTTGKQN
jgi:hypothetical protein